MEQFSRLRITILARSFPNDNNDNDSHKWHLRLLCNEEAAADEVTISDPLDARQVTECCWYLERFIQRSPYSVTRAKNAAGLLQQYGKTLVQQLGLLDIISHATNGDPTSPLVVDILVKDESGSGASVHQLYWELLETEEVWKPYDVRVTVTRLSVRNIVATHPLAGNKESTPSPSVNVLVVVARDLTTEHKRYDEVDPSLATGILTDISDAAATKIGKSTVNVEIVRPGSLTALTLHLRRTKDFHGSGYFDLIHFDLHGEVDVAGKRAYLLFNSKDGGTQREDAQEIGGVLEEYSIRAVVLNACESARADAGGDANIGQIFQKNGVQNVLAMSHKISTTAAKIFLVSFYQTLLLHGLPFSAAAREARSALRKAAGREARYGLQRQLLDFFLPVAYLSQPDSPHLEDIRDTHHDLEFEKPKEDRLYGRGFDLLRLENLLQAHHFVFLSGLAGVGKTALLQEARKLWIKTAFVDVVFNNDVSMTKDENFQQFLASLIAQMPLYVSDKRNVVDKMNEVLLQPSYEMSDLVSTFLQSIPGRRYIFIFDGLHIAHSRWTQKILGYPGTELMETINRFISALITATRSPSYSEDVYLIFVNRRPILNPALKEVIPHDMDNISLVLKPLRMSDAIILAQSILQKHGASAQEWTDFEVTELELSLDLLQCIPGAMTAVFGVIARAGIPRHQLQAFIHHDLCEESPGVVDDKLFGQLIHFSKWVRDGLFAMLLVLSLYWHEPPDLGHFSTTISSSGLFDDDNALGLTLSLLVDQGYMNVMPDGQSMTIHPLFTIYGRLIANTYRKTAIEQSKSLTHTIFGGAKQWVSFWFRPTHEKTTRAAFLVMALWQGTLEGVSPGDVEAVSVLRDRFLESVATKAVSRLVGDHLKGTSFGDIVSRWNVDLANLQTCIYLCLSQPPIPLDQWPLDFFQQQAAGIRLYSTTAQVTHFAGELGRILARFIEFSGGHALKPEQQGFGLTMASCLAAAYRNEIGRPELWKKYVQLGLDIVTASEARYGPMTSFETKYLKALLMRYKALTLIEEGSQEEAEELWQSMLDLEGSFVNGHSQNWTNAAEDNISALANHFARNGEDADAVRGRARSLLGYSLPLTFSETRKDSMKLIKMFGEIRRQGGDYENTREFKTVMASLGFGLERVLDAHEGAGLHDLDLDERWWPENLDMLKFSRRYKKTHNRLDDLEDAMNTGNPSAAAQHHEALLWEAAKVFDLDEVDEHVQALERIYQNNPAFEQRLQEVRKRKATAQSMKALSQALKAGSDSVGNDLLDAFARYKETVAENGAPAEVNELLDINLQMLAQDRELYGEQSLVSSSAGDSNEQTVQSLIRRILPQLGNASYIEQLPATALEVVKLQREIQIAEAAKDHDAERAALDRYEELSRRPVAADMIDRDWIDRRKKEMDRLLLWQPHLDRWTKAMNETNFTAARKCLDAMASEQPERWSSEWATERLRQLRKSTETMHWESTYQAAMAAFDQQDFEKSAELLDELVRLYDGEGFSNVDDEIRRKYLYATRSNQLVSHANLAIHASEWQKAREYCNEWEGFVKDSSEDDIVDDRHRFQDLKELCEFKIHVSGFEKAMEALKTNEASRHLVALYELSDQQTKTPAVRRRLAPIVPKDMLAAFQQGLLLMGVAKSVRSWTVEDEADTDDGGHDADHNSAGSGAEGLTQELDTSENAKNDENMREDVRRMMQDPTMWALEFLGKEAKQTSGNDPATNPDHLKRTLQIDTDAKSHTEQR